MDDGAGRAGLKGRILELCDRVVDVRAPAGWTNARAEAWLVVPGGSEGFAAGTTVDAYMLRE